MNKGVSLISLIVTIVVIIILASITIFNSMDTIEDSNLAKKEKEFKDVCTYVTNVSSKALADTIQLNLSGDTLATAGQITNIYSENTDLAIADTHKINDMNEAIRNEGRNAKYGYHFITGKEIENGILGINVSSNLENVDNDYIINFYYGVVIAKMSETNTKVFGAIK